MGHVIDSFDLAATFVRFIFKRLSIMAACFGRNDVYFHVLRVAITFVALYSAELPMMGARHWINLRINGSGRVFVMQISFHANF